MLTLSLFEGNLHLFDAHSFPLVPPRFICIVLVFNVDMEPTYLGLSAVGWKVMLGSWWDKVIQTIIECVDA